MLKGLLEKIAYRTQQDNEKTPAFDFEIEAFQGIGSRDEQQDSIFVTSPADGFDTRKNGILAAVADGMGGMNSGEKISNRTVEALKAYCLANPLITKAGNKVDEYDYMRDMLEYVVEDVKNYQNTEKLEGSGSTLVCVHLKNDYMSFLAVGDSRIYLLRNGELRQLNTEHTLLERYLKKLSDGVFSWDEYRKAPGGNGLTAYIGAEGLEEFDIPENSIRLNPGDVIMLFSDGVFGTLSEREIKAIAEKRNVSSACSMMTEAIEKRLKEHQDNYSGILIRYLD